MAYRDVDLRVRCPYCRAAVDRYCRKSHPTRNLGFTKQPHLARVKLADEKATEGTGKPVG